MGYSFHILSNKIVKKAKHFSRPRPKCPNDVILKGKGKEDGGIKRDRRNDVMRNLLQDSFDGDIFVLALWYFLYCFTFSSISVNKFSIQIIVILFLFYLWTNTNCS